LFVPTALAAGGLVLKRGLFLHSDDRLHDGL
jgi:hypothetical protein